MAPRSERVLAGNSRKSHVIALWQKFSSGHSPKSSIPDQGYHLMLSMRIRSLIPELGTQLLSSLGFPICLFLTLSL